MMRTFLLLTVTLLQLLQAQTQDEERLSESELEQKIQNLQKEFNAAAPNSFEYFDSLFKIRFTYIEYSNYKTVSSMDERVIDFDLMNQSWELTKNWDTLPSEAELKTMVKNKKITKIQPGFQIPNSKSLRETIHKAGNIFIYEGPMRNPKGVYTDVKWQTINNQHFLPGKREVTPVQAIDLQQLVGTDNYFVDFGGSKACGGFRADYMIEWMSEEKPVQLMICNGCHEIIIIHDEQWFKHDFGNAQAPEIKKIMAQFDQQRHALQEPRPQKTKRIEGPGLTDAEKAEIEAIMKGIKK